MLFYKLLFFYLFSLLAYGNVEIEISIKGFDNNKGQVLCAIVTEAKDFLKTSAKAVDEQIVKVENSQAECRLKLAQDGIFAVSVFHDLDANNKLKTDAFGIALEPWGVSNNIPASSFGPPSFDQAKVDSKKQKKLTIQLNK